MTSLQQISDRANRLREQVQFATTQFDKWTEESTKILDERADKFHLQTIQAEEYLKNLLNKEKVFKSGAIQLQQTLAKESEQEFLLSNSLSQLRLKEKELPEVVLKSKIELEAARQEVQKQRTVLTEQQNSKAQILNELTKGIGFFKERLGLEFHRTGGNLLRFIFRLVDPKDDKREFYFTLFIDAQDTYTVQDCQPSLPPALLTSALAELNCSNNLGKFTVTMRNGFKSTL